MTLPTRHPNDTKWKTHCVDCGSIIVEHAVESGWEYNTIGVVVASNPGERNFGGWRCPACNDKLRAFVAAYYA